MPAIFWLFLISSALALPCRPHEIFIRDQWIDTYFREDGVKVNEHPRSSHCRELLKENYFQDSTAQIFKNIKPKIKKWNHEEKKMVENYLSKVPRWLKNYKVDQILRGDIGGHPRNPASAIPLTRTLLIFDRFFMENDKTAVLTHELAHFAFHSIDFNQILGFAAASGWKTKEKMKPIPPLNLLSPDAGNSISEDFATHIETYYSNPKKLQTFNANSFLVIQKIIKTKEEL